LIPREYGNVDKITLTATSFLDGMDIQVGSARLREVTDMALASVAIPMNGAPSVSEALKSAFGLEMPGNRTSTQFGSARALLTGPDQIFLLLADRPDLATDDVEGAFEQSAYVTEQSSNWVICAVSGPDIRAALERLCPIDLHPNAFPVGAYARTVMEHMGAMIIRTDADSYLLLSTSSSARSFAHAVELSLRYTQDANEPEHGEIARFPRQKTGQDS
jgi:sarcosine oxidase subunit gamma